MNCEQCQELLSPYLDNELEQPVSASVRTHLSLCAECAEVCEDLAAIMDLYALDDSAKSQTIDSAELWDNISKGIEKEAKTSGRLIFASPARRGLNRIWRLTLPQAVASVAAIVVVTSLLTFVALSGWISPSSVPADSIAEQSPFEKLMAAAGIMDSPEEQIRKRIEQRRQAIDFWNKRIEARRVQWDGHFRDAFDRNLSEIDQVVNEYSQALERNPDDALSGEMLDSALYDKEELLRAFSEL